MMSCLKKFSTIELYHQCCLFMELAKFVEVYVSKSVISQAENKISFTLSFGSP